MKKINQFSKNGKSICIELHSGYIVLIDLCYYVRFVKDNSLSPKENILNHLETNFPEAGLDLIDVIHLDNFIEGKYTLDIDAIKYHSQQDDDMILVNDKGYFGLDTATILVIDYEDFDLFNKTMNDTYVYENSYDNIVFIERMNEIIGRQSFAIIESPGIESDFEFMGDGSYFIEKIAFKRDED
jgi:hypothetical protein